MLKKIPVLAGVLALMACAETYQPVVDLKGMDGGRYQQDLAECRRLGMQVDAAGDTAVNTLVGAGVGAAMGAALGAIAGSPASGAAMGAAVGGIGTGAGSGVSKVERQKRIIDQCLSRRGYNVLG
ncbi:MAG: hypothetical protein WBK91_02840 [Alphaproteobacteria bacterium]